MSEYKYTLIISQYYHSYNMFLVKFDENRYYDQMREFTKKLCEYKRGNCEWYKDKSLEVGDCFYYEKQEEPRFRYNVNDSGDIYFLNFRNASSALYDMKKYFEEEKRASQGYKRKAVLEEISKYHSENKIFEIVKSIYEIA